MNHRRAPGGGDTQPIMQFFLILLPLLLLCAEAQSDNSNGSNSSSSNNNNNKSYGFSPNFNPSMAIVIVVLISAFFFLGFFSIYLRQCFGDSRDSLSVTRGRGVGARSRRQRGLDPEVLATFPTLVYSEIKGHKIGKGALECAVCLCEFENDETLRLLPKCNHVFHPDCIDAWLASHVTCPVCRSDLAHVTPDDAPVLTAGESHRAAEEQDPPRQAETALPEHVAIAVNDGSAEERKAELADLARIASRRRAATAGTRFPRSHSTGHSLVLVHQGDNHDRFTLRLPENIRREIVAAGRMQRAKSVRAFPVGGLEGSTRRGYRGGGVGDGSNRGGRSIRLGRSDRWPSFLMRNISARMPAWATGRRWDGEGSTKKGESGDGSTKGKVSSVRVQFDCLGGGAGGGKTDLAGGDGESSSTAAVARV